MQANFHVALNYIYAPSNGNKELKPAAPPRTDVEQDLAGKRVVIVEDEGITQLQLRRLLVSSGLVVVGVAADGPSGVDAVLREKPDIVLMDVKMPGEYDGMEAARRILAQFSTCLIMLTAHEDYQDEAFAIGASGYVVKPVDGRTLLPRLVEANRRSRPQ